MGGNRRSLQLDFLRGVAILLVVGAHLDTFPQPSGVVGFFAHAWLLTGWLGVDLFFALSGFLIAGLLLTEYERHGTIRPGRFLLRRGLKIYPLYLVFIGYLVFKPVAEAAVTGGDPLEVLGQQWSMYWTTLLFIQTYVGVNYAGHTWSVALEEHFYLLLPFVLVFLVRRRALLPLCFIGAPLICLGFRALSVANGDDYSVTMSLTQSRLDALLFGVGLQGLAVWHRDAFAWLGARRLVLVLLGLLCWSTVFVVGFERPAWFGIVGLSGTFIGAGCFLVAALHTHGHELPWFLRSIARGIGEMGKYSYGIYLWHITVLLIVDNRIGAPITEDWGPTSAWLVRVVLAATSACVVGALMSRLVEWPILRLRDRWFPSRTLVKEIPDARAVVAA